MAKTRIDKLIDQAEQTNAQIRALTEVILLSGRLAQSIPAPLPAKALLGVVPKVQEVQSELYFDTVRGIVQAAEDVPGAFRDRKAEANQLQRTIRSNFNENQPAVVKKVRTKRQKANDKLQSAAFKQANKALRTSKGVLRKGRSQADVAKRAQKLLRGMKSKKTSAKKGRVANRKASKRSSRK